MRSERFSSLLQLAILRCFIRIIIIWILLFRGPKLIPHDYVQKSTAASFSYAVWETRSITKTILLGPRPTSFSFFLSPSSSFAASINRIFSTGIFSFSKILRFRSPTRIGVSGIQWGRNNSRRYQECRWSQLEEWIEYEGSWRSSRTAAPPSALPSPTCSSTLWCPPAW